MKSSLKQRLAVALKYKYGVDLAPLVLATGRGISAETIVKKAEELKIPVHQDKVLSELLVQVDVGDSIPEELFDAVAQVIAMVYQMDSQLNAH